MQALQELQARHDATEHRGKLPVDGPVMPLVALPSWFVQGVVP